MNEDVEPLRLRATEDGHLVIHRPILNEKLYQVDDFMFNMAEELNIEDINWSMRQIDKLYKKFEKRFGSISYEEN